jgi:predicted ATPase
MRRGLRSIGKSTCGASRIPRPANLESRLGLDVLAALPDGPWRRQQELDLRIALGPALMATTGSSSPDVGETYARARMLAEQLDRPDYLVSLLYGQWMFHLGRSELKLALSHASQIEQIGEIQNDIAVQMRGHQLHGTTCFFLGEFVVARALLEQCHDPSHPAVLPVYETLPAQEAQRAMLAFLALTLTYLGYIDQGRALMNEALSTARRVGHVYPLAEVLIFSCWVEWVASSPHEAQRHADEVVALSNEHGFPYWLSMGIMYQGWSLAALGHAQEGLTLLMKGLSAMRATGAAAATPWAFIMLAEAYAKLGRPVEGQIGLDEATQFIETTDERYNEAELHRLRGELLVAIGDFTAAEVSFHQAIAVARRQQAKLWELRAATSLTRLWRDQGKRTEARDLLAPIYAWFTEGFDTPVLTDAKALLAQLA